MALQESATKDTVSVERPPRVIVVGVDADQLTGDGPHPSLDAVVYAAGMARRLQARLVPVWVRNPIAMSDTFVESIPTLLEERERRSEEVERTIEAAVEGIEPGSLVVCDGNPFEELSAVAEDVGADAIIVGASEHRIGSLAVRLVRAARWPVTVVP